MGTYDVYTNGIHSYGHEIPKKISFDSYQNNGKIFDFTSISQVEINKDHSVALTEEGLVYSWGMGEKGRLGLGDTEFRPYPDKVNFVHFSKMDKSKEMKKIHEFDLEYEKIKDSQK